MIFLIWPVVPTYWRCRGLLSHLIALNDTHSVELLWARDRPDAETSTKQHTILTGNRHPYSPAGFEPTISKSERPPVSAIYVVLWLLKKENIFKKCFANTFI